MVIEERYTKKKGFIFKKIFNYLLIALIGTIGFFLITDRNYFITGIKQIIGVGENHVVYNTYTVSFDASISSDLENSIKDVLGNISYDGIKRFEFVENGGNITIKYDSVSEENIDLLLSLSFLVPVGHIYWIEDSFTTEDGETVYVENQSEADFISSNTTLSPVDIDNLLDTLEYSEDTAGFIPIEDLSFDYKLLYMDGGYFLDDFTSGIPRMLLAEIDDEDDFSILTIVKSILNDFDTLPESYDENTVSKVNMTGVTAIARDLASKIEASGDYAYPAEYIADFLSDADLTHTSNEVSFVEGCTPNTSMSFCSSPNYIAALEAIGVDIIELTGNHNNDYGADYNTSTIETYINEGWDYFGGGLDDEDASEILYKEVDGTTIAFIGYNYYDTMLGSGAIASDTHAGANYYSEEKMLENITEAEEQADVVIVDFQFQECYSYPDTDRIYPICYQPLSSPDQEYTFRLAIDDGADIVIGTQAHQPQTYELYGNGIIYYGLGNLFFDQYEWIGTRQGIILTHYFVNGVHVQTKMTATMYNTDLQVRLATEDEADELFELLKEARE